MKKFRTEYVAWKYDENGNGYAAEPQVLAEFSEPMDAEELVALHALRIESEFDVLRLVNNETGEVVVEA